MKYKEILTLINNNSRNDDEIMSIIRQSFFSKNISSKEYQELNTLVYLPF
jgi:hypothetical protein